MESPDANEQKTESKQGQGHELTIVLKMPEQQQLGPRSHHAEHEHRDEEPS